MNINVENYRAVIDEINDAITKSEKVEIINKYGLNCAPKLKDMEQAVYDILREGTLKAQETTNRTLDRVRKAMRIDYFDDRRIVKEWEALLKETQPRGRR